MDAPPQRVPREPPGPRPVSPGMAAWSELALDDVAMTLRHRLLIDAWESRTATDQPWLQQITSPA